MKVLTIVYNLQWSFHFKRLIFLLLIMRKNISNAIPMLILANIKVSSKH